MKRKLKLCLIFILIVVAMTIISFIKPNKVEAYTSCSADDAINWLDTLVGTKEGSGQCVALVSKYYDHLGNVTPSYYYAYELAGCKQPDGWQYIEGAQPQKGDILVYSPGTNTAGHVAIYASDNVTYHQNYMWSLKISKEIGYYKTIMGSSAYYKGVVRPDFINSSLAIDTVTEGKLYKARLKNNSMTIDGWAMTDASGAFVQIYVDNDLAVATHNVERYDRPDVSSNKNVGYRAHYDYSVLKDGEHTLSVRLYSAEHNVLVEKKVKFKVLHVDMSVDTIKNGDVFYKHKDTSKNTFDVNGYAVTKYKNSFVQFYLDDNSDCYVATHNILRGSYDGITGYTNPGYYRTINYSNLPLGEHTLKIRLFEKDVNQILEEIDVKFTIKEELLYFSSLNKQFNTINIKEQLKAKTSDGLEKIVDWVSDNPKVIEVSSNGYVTPKSGGFAHLTSATTDPTYGTANVWVYVSYPVTLSDGSLRYVGDLDGDKKFTNKDADVILDYFKYSKKGADDILLGDIDGNGVVDTADAAEMNNIIRYKTFQIVETPYILGDVDNNGKVDVKDAIMVLQYSSEKIKLTETQKLAANVDKTSSDVNIKDAIKILQYTSEKIKTFD